MNESKLNIWHKRDELKDFQGLMAYFFCRDYKIREVSYIGGLSFEYLGMRFDNDFMLFWCDRRDLLKQTNLNNLIQDFKEY